MKRTKIHRLLISENPLDFVLLKGWVRTRRDSKGFSFLEINDGSCLKNIQVLAEASLANYDEITAITTGSAVAVTGSLVPSPGKGQQWEVHAADVNIIGSAPDTYPLQKKRHTDEYLRSIAHLRPRSNKYGAMFRMRSELALAVHQFFRDREFRYIHTPILTGSDCEGAGEMFRVVTPNRTQEKLTGGDSEEFFGREANLTVSGQLSAEMFALALGDVYTFGPTFRAENSNTRRHAAEFWMVEPEMAFADLYDDMNLGESLIQYLIDYVLTNCSDDLNLFATFVDKELMKELKRILDSPFIRLPYSEAVKILTSSKQHFEYDIAFGIDLQSEHERYLTEVHFKQPVILFDYPKSIKPFYMRVNDDDKTVAAMDILVPRIGEIIGGSQREERVGVLEARMDEMGLNRDAYWWYLDSRRYGSAPHCGFGMGFERVLMMMTGVGNIRDVIPFPRTPGSIDF
ncbi:MAG: asparagine--tRNA ligase [Desulfatirhabdiaceae bacterium]